MKAISVSSGLKVGPQEWAPRNKGHNETEMVGTAHLQEADRSRARQWIRATTAGGQPQHQSGAYNTSVLKPYYHPLQGLKRIWEGAYARADAQELEQANFGHLDKAPIRHGLRNEFTNDAEDDMLTDPVHGRMFHNIPRMSQRHDPAHEFSQSRSIRNGVPLLYSDAS